MSILNILWSMVVATACAQSLPRNVTSNAPVAKGTPIDLTRINVKDIQTGSDVNLAQYMQDNDLQHMLITFGSLGCSACMEKTRYLEANLVENSLALGGLGETFAVRGVNVDPESKHLDLVNTVEDERLTHLTWSDPQREAMMTYFQPKGAKYGVPLTVMINRSRMLWYYAKDDYISPQDLVNKVRVTLGENAVPLPPVETKPTPTIEPLSILADERPDRLTALQGVVCGDSPTKSVQDVFGDAGLKMLVVDRGACEAGSVCAENRAALNAFVETCAESSCKVVTLAQEASLERSCDKSVVKGGKEVFETFSDHFSWNLPITVSDDGRKSLPEVAGPLTLIFDASGKLVFSRNGALNAEELRSAWQADKMTSRAPGPAFVMESPDGLTNFSVERQKAKWTLMLFWDVGCGSCNDEIAKWHLPGDVMEFCGPGQASCQVLSLDEKGGWELFETFPAYVEHYVDKFKNLGWSIPYYYEPLSAPFPQWWAGWIAAKFGSGYRSVLFDIEGKVRGTWLSDGKNEGPFEMLKKFKAEQP